MKPRDDLTAKYVRECFDYNAEKGEFTWKQRPLHHFASQHGQKCCNAYYAGKPAKGCPNTKGYLQIRVNKKLYFAHRLAWLHFYGEHPKDQIDHINCIKTDNRISNLREATNFENSRNTKINSRNKSGFKGVRWHVRDKVWRAEIRINKKYVYLGSFKSPEEAHVVYIKAAEKLHGKFSRVI